MNYDTYIVEHGDGGDMYLAGNDVRGVFGIENMPYLCMYGGTDNAADYWGNNLLQPNRADRQFKSETTAVGNSIALNSAGRLKVEQTIAKDLRRISDNIPGLKIEVIVYLNTLNRWDADITFTGIDLTELWDITKVIKPTIPAGIGYWSIGIDFRVS